MSGTYTHVHLHSAPVHTKRKEDYDALFPMSSMFAGLGLTDQNESKNRTTPKDSMGGLMSKVNPVS